MSCLKTASCVYTAGSLTGSPHAAFVPAAIVLSLVASMYMGGMVGAARSKYKIAYPTLYAVPGTARSYAPGAVRLRAVTARAHAGA
jgi:hypothetical protein